jgi:hypothetical protein
LFEVRSPARPGLGIPLGDRLEVPCDRVVPTDPGPEEASQFHQDPARLEEELLTRRNTPDDLAERL